MPMTGSALTATRTVPSDRVHHRCTGPLSNALGGADLSFVVGPIVTAGVYAVLFRSVGTTAQIPG
jgi:hypothetical protein